MIVNFKNEVEKYNSAEHKILVSSFHEAHEKISGLYLEAIAKKVDTKVLFKLLTFFEKCKYSIDNNTIQFEKEFENNKLFASLISQVMLAKLSNDSFVDKQSVKELNKTNDQEIIKHFNNYEQEHNNNFEVKL